MRRFVKQIARRSKIAIILYKIFDNQRLKRRVKSGDIVTSHGSAQFNKDVAHSLNYIEKQFADYIDYARLSPTDLAGKKILELGPGDNLGVALRFVAAGAATVVSVDRFYSKRNLQHEIEIYKTLRARLNTEEQKRFDGAISLNTEVTFNAGKLRTVYGARLEELTDKLVHDYKAFDLILSCAVLEEIYEPNSIFVAMDKLLAPGGMLVHKIDLGDYGMFRDQGMHPLTFLTIPEAIYKRMASDSGLPNRKRLSYYIAKLEELGYQSQFFVTSTIPTGRLEPHVAYNAGRFSNNSGTIAVNEIRGRLARDFKDIDDEELLIDGILLTGRKPDE